MAGKGGKGIGKVGAKRHAKKTAKNVYNIDTWSR